MLSSGVLALSLAWGADWAGVLAAPPLWLVEPLALAGIAAGADGLMVEVHNDPPHAKCDGQQSLTPTKFDNLMKKVESLRDWTTHIGSLEAKED